MGRPGSHGWPQSRGQGHGPLPCRQEDDPTGNFATLLTKISVRFEALSEEPSQTECFWPELWGLAHFAKLCEYLLPPAPTSPALWGFTHGTFRVSTEEGALQVTETAHEGWPHPV